MIRDFSREELAPAGNDTEVTLGIGALLAIGCGLFLLCGICFGLGYVAGHRSSPDPTASATQPVQDSRPSTRAAGPEKKPGAGAQMTAPSATDGADDGSTDGKAHAEQVSGQVPGQISGPVPSSVEVRPAVQTGVRPALTSQSQAQGWMVQIAAVSHAEDAQVLVDALRKRGYEVAARRDAGDNLIHVRTGPFVSRNDANAMRQKLLNDGYNAIVQ